MSAAVVVRGVDKIFDTKSGHVTALSAVDLDVAPGEFVSLIGPSGCGKSTLMRLIADLETPTAGTVEVFGTSAHQARVDQRYGIAFQQAGLLPWRTVSRTRTWPKGITHRRTGRRYTTSIRASTNTT
jgi:NitT/TauT family transport system ATP-binding protein